ncbi:MFS transporter [Conexibacter arvalis]|nr:MFS transporter [Conexibacter arvalis]
MRVLLLSQVLAGAGLAAGVSVGALLAQEMLGSTGSAGLPAALLTLGSAVAALLVGRLSQASGRRPGLAAGYVVGAIGAVGVVLAAAIDSIPLLFGTLLLYGSGTATNLQARYAGGDLADASSRGRAMSTVLVATTLGAVVGPNLVEPSGTLATSLGIRALAGPFMLAAIAYAVAGVAVWLLLRPDPLLLAREQAGEEATAPAAADEDDDPVALSPTVLLGGAGMVVTQLVMVAIMTMTPVHMHDHGHGLGASGLVISIHIAAMYLPSPLSGWLADRVGRRPMLAVAALTLLAAGVCAAIVPPDSTLLLAFALALLGLGWSFGLAAGTALVTDGAPLAQRARIQGGADLCVALAGATGGLGSGYVVAATSYHTLSLLGGLIGLALLPLLLLLASGRRAGAP